MGTRGSHTSSLTAWFVVATWLLLATPPALHAEGESVGGFPNWAERVFVEWTNRARSDPQADLLACGSSCGDAACYTPMAPLPTSLAANRAARFHSDEMTLQGYLEHDSHCDVVTNIDQLYPGSCNGAASCACVGGIQACPCTSFDGRAGLFGVNVAGELLAGFGDPNAGFYAMLHQPFPHPLCEFTVGSPTNGERFTLLTSSGLVGTGLNGSNTTVLIAAGTRPVPRIPSGSHYPRQAASVDAWVNWFDSSGPSVRLINVAGACSTMTLARGTQQNGAWKATVSGVGSGCHRYVFSFKAANGDVVFYPSTGSLAIGSGPSCPDWHASAPAPCAGFNNIFADSFKQ